MPAVDALLAYDGVSVATLAADAGAAQVIAVEECSSTMDLAHALAAAGAPHGSVVVAARQLAGRGRSGKTWHSEGGTGVWMSVLLRTVPAAAAALLSLRTGLALATRLDVLAAAPVRLKWPNDLLLDGGKLAGVLTEARWRGDVMEWIVVGVGVNVRAPSAPAAAQTVVPFGALIPGARLAAVLVEVVRAVLEAAARTGMMSEAELSAYATRDAVAGRAIRAPLAGIVRGIDASGALVVQSADGAHRAVAGSLEFDHTAPEH